MLSLKFEKHVADNFIDSMKTRRFRQMRNWWRNTEKWRKQKTKRRMLKSDKTVKKIFFVFEECWYRKVTKTDYRLEKKSWYKINAKVDDVIECFNTTTTNYDREKKLQKRFFQTNWRKLIKFEKFYDHIVINDANIMLMTQTWCCYQIVKCKAYDVKKIMY